MRRKEKGLTAELSLSSLLLSKGVDEKEDRDIIVAIAAALAHAYKVLLLYRPRLCRASQAASVSLVLGLMLAFPLSTVLYLVLLAMQVKETDRMTYFEDKQDKEVMRMREEREERR